jgi:hypothetical protein
MPVAFIDWDAAQPIKPLADIASAAWTFVPFAPPEQLAEAGFHPLPDLPARLRMFVDAYGLTDRQAILPELRRCIQDEPGPLRWFQRIMANLASALSPNRGALEPPQGIPDRNGDISSSDQRRAHDRRQRRTLARCTATWVYVRPESGRSGDGGAQARTWRNAAHRQSYEDAAAAVTGMARASCHAMCL